MKTLLNILLSLLCVILSLTATTIKVVSLGVKYAPYAFTLTLVLIGEIVACVPFVMMSILRAFVLFAQRIGNIVNSNASLVWYHVNRRVSFLLPRVIARFWITNHVSINKFYVKMHSKINGLTPVDPTWTDVYPGKSVDPWANDPHGND